VSPDPAAIGRNREVDVGIVGDCGAVLDQLLAEAAAHGAWGRPDWLAALREATQAAAAGWATADRLAHRPIHPYRLCREVAALLRPDDIVVVDGGDTRLWANLAIHPGHPGWYLQVGPIGGIGHGVPYALAAKLAFPDRRVLLVSGDGAFGYGIMEYDTAVRHGIPFVTVISSDRAWGIVRHDQIHEYGAARSVGTGLTLTRYEEMVRTLGGHGEFVEAPEGIGPAVERAFASGLPACVNVPVRSTNPIYEDAATGALRY
jgi:acetolactate synthase-1/2/3 large subunit